jgi:hypothetical protein
MPSTPVFVTQYEILRSQDYVLLTLSAPSGKVVDGRMQTDEVERVALTIPRFLEFAATLGQMADNIRAHLAAARAATPAPARSDRAATADADEGPTLRGPGDVVIRH